MFNIYLHMVLRLHDSSSGAVTQLKVVTTQNKPASQAADADPSQCNSTNKKSPPIQ